MDYAGKLWNCWGGTDTSSFYHIQRIPSDCSTSNQIQGTCANLQYNKCVVTVGDTRDNCEARVFCVGWATMENTG